jgi:hypothetical protein
MLRALPFAAQLVVPAPFAKDSGLRYDNRVKDK